MKKYSDALEATQNALHYAKKKPGTFSRSLKEAEERMDNLRGVIDAEEQDKKNDAALAAYDVGFKLFEKQRYAEAEQEFRRALLHSPNVYEADTLNMLGLALFHQQRYAEAEAAFQKALSLKPDLATARNNLDRVQTTVGQRRREERAGEEIRRGVSNLIREFEQPSPTSASGPTRGGAFGQLTIAEAEATAAREIVPEDSSKPEASALAGKTFDQGSPVPPGAPIITSRAGEDPVVPESKLASLPAATRAKVIKDQNKRDEARRQQRELELKLREAQASPQRDPMTVTTLKAKIAEQESVINYLNFTIREIANTPDEKPAPKQP